jgi:hypothetical protein
MPADGFFKRFRRWWSGAGDEGLVCEIAADYVAALRYHDGRGLAWAVRPLPEGAVQPSPLGENIADAAGVEQALENLLGVVGTNRRRFCALILPDLVARVAVLEFDRLPAGSQQADALVRWRLSRDLPFDLRQAVLSYQVQPGRGTGQEVVTAVSVRAVVRQYEELVERLGLRPAWVTLSTLAALGCLDDGGAAHLLVKRDHGSLGLSILHGKAVRLFRSLPLAAPDQALTDAALFEKVYPAGVYFQDQWEQPVGEVVLAGALGDRSGLVALLAEETGCAVRRLDPEAYELPPAPASTARPDFRLLSSLGWARGGAE